MRKARLLFIPLALALVVSHSMAQHHQSDLKLSSRKSPALAAVLSLQPIPVDLGSFYAGNWERGILYTAAEVALFIPAIVLITENSNWFGHHRYDSYYYTDPNRRTWTRAERERFYYFIGGYLLVKVISAFDAGYTVERSNATLSVRYEREQNSLGLSMAIPIR